MITNSKTLLLYAEEKKASPCSPRLKLRLSRGYISKYVINAVLHVCQTVTQIKSTCVAKSIYERSILILTKLYEVLNRLGFHGIFYVYTYLYNKYFFSVVWSKLKVKEGGLLKQNAVLEHTLPQWCMERITRDWLTIEGVGGRY